MGSISFAMTVDSLVGTALNQKAAVKSITNRALIQLYSSHPLCNWKKFSENSFTVYCATVIFLNESYKTTVRFPFARESIAAKVNFNVFTASA